MLQNNLTVQLLPDMVAHAIQVAETGGLKWVQGQLELCSKTASKQNKLVLKLRWDESEMRTTPCTAFLCKAALAIKTQNTIC